jgi:hypothetical protein
MEVSMRTVRKWLVLPLISFMALSSTAFAQQRHAVDPAALAQAVVERVADQDAVRAAIDEALARPEVRDMAAKMRVDLDAVAGAVSTLEGAELQRAGAAAQQVNQALVGGASTVVISTTTIIIGLLVLLLLIVAID